MGNSRLRYGVTAAFGVAMVAAFFLNASPAVAQAPCPSGSTLVGSFQGSAVCAAGTNTFTVALPPSTVIVPSTVNPAAGPPTTQGFPSTAGVHSTGTFSNSTTGPVDAPGFGDSALGGLINLDSGATDPYVSITSTRDTGSGISSASGMITGPLKTHSVDLGVGGYGNFNASHTFSIDDEQRLLIGGFLDHDSQHTTYSTPLSLGNTSRSIYEFGPYVRYDLGDAHIFWGISGLLGSGSETNYTASSMGSFNSSGFATAAVLGKTFWLYNGLSYQNPPPPTGPRPPPIGGYAFQVDLSGHGGYFDDHTGGFTDSAGFITGTEQYHYGFAGARAELVATLPSERLVWNPFVALAVDQKFAFTHTVSVPTQPGFAGDTLSFSEGQTTPGGYAGVRIRDASGISVGLDGFYRHSSNISSLGGEVDIAFPLLQWLSPQGSN
jgi:hypothetical protein